MELDRLIAGLSQPSAFPFPAEKVEVRQTHASVVFLAGEFAYKIKKPVNLGFLDFSTLEKRRQDCEAEVRLNRRLAPAVYLGVVPVTEVDGVLRWEAAGEPVEWAVKMRRLPDEATLQSRLLRGEIGISEVENLARRVAEFHRDAATGLEIARFGRFEVVSRNILDNFDATQGHIGVTVSATVFQRVRTLTEQELQCLRPVIESRAEHGLPRDTHGDLHLDHVYLFPDRPPPDDLVIVDCIEFNDRFRYADPIADMAFLHMDLLAHGRPDLARAFAEAYFGASGDEEGRQLLRLYTAYRAAVRGKVEGMKALEPEVPPEDREKARLKAQRHWLLALGIVETPQRRPCLILVGGLPGSGKSTLARHLAERAGCELIRTDVVRKELAGLAPTESGRAAFGEGIYAPEWSERTYAECLERSRRLLFEGRRVIVDAVFLGEGRRHRFLNLARQWAVPGLLLICQASPETISKRLAGRRGDASDADWQVYELLAPQWQPPGEALRPVTQIISTEGPVEDAVQQALDFLRRMEVQ
ncbi:MAG: AAA family ATPase [Gemmatales bacterium]|nr:AAA family ATPase [Gemmatales bacterium]MDW8385884.1 AAA family ATPase [Gemmatales bacterium]